MSGGSTARRRRGRGRGAHVAGVDGGVDVGGAAASGTAADPAERVDAPAARRSKLFGGRDLTLLADTAMLSASSIVLLIIAARTLTPHGLTSFSLAQPLIVTVVGGQRATFLSPALVVQRTAGRSHVPLVWIARVSLPLAVAASIAGGLTLGLSQGRALQVGVIVLFACLAALAQDMMRYRLLSRGQIRGALVSDSTLFVLTAGTIALAHFIHDWVVFLLLWGSWMTVSCIVALIAMRSFRGERLRGTLIRDTLKLGRWSGLDSVLGTIAYLLPLYISSLVLGSVYAGVYRVLQSANGPLNILDTTIVTSFGLDAWSITGTDDVRNLQRKVRQLVFIMSGLAALYLVFAEVAIVFTSGIQSPDLVRIGIIVLIAGVIGALTTPFSAGSLALGYQKSGAIIRTVVVVVSIGISLGVSVHIPLPWNDPIGAVALFAPAAGAVGWILSFRAATRRELRGMAGTAGRGVTA